MRYHLGLPAWAFAGWKDRYFTTSPSALASYACVFGTVEGNTTFYAVPDARSVRRWRDAVEHTSFRFCFKLPRTVTHERPASGKDLAAFFAALEPLGDRLGPFLLQFPASLGPADLDALCALLELLPGAYRYALEVRHPAFFSDPGLLEPLIDRFSLGRVTLDSRALHGGDPSHPEVRDALHEKPDLPVLDAVYNGIAFTRLVLHPDPAHNARWLDDVAARSACNLTAGHEVYVMVHCPNNLHCPPYAVDFHERLRARHEVAGRLPPLAPFPVPQQQPLI